MLIDFVFLFSPFVIQVVIGLADLGIHYQEPRVDVFNSPLQGDRDRNLDMLEIDPTDRISLYLKFVRRNRDKIILQMSLEHFDTGFKLFLFVLRSLDLCFKDSILLL